MSERVARLVGLLVFFFGVALVVFVFFQAYGLFNAPPPKLVLPSPTPIPLPTPLPAPGATPMPAVAAESPLPAAAAGLAVDLAGFVRRLLALLLMCIAGGAIASLGIRMTHAPHRAAQKP